MTASRAYLANIQPAKPRDVKSYTAATVHCPACNYQGSTFRRVVPTRCARCHFDRMQWGKGEWRGQGEGGTKA